MAGAVSVVGVVEWSIKLSVEPWWQRSWGMVVTPLCYDA